MNVVFDRLLFVKHLEGEGGFTRPQAESLSEAFHQAVAETVATTQDLDLLRSDQKLAAAELRSVLALLRTEIRAAFSENRAWTVGVGASIVAALAAMKYFG